MAKFEKIEVLLDHGVIYRGWAHTKDSCALPGQCTIHHPSDHHMRHMKPYWRGDRVMMERICEHGVGHPDPDQVAYWKHTLSERAANAETVHGCDGCCARPDEPDLLALKERNRLRDVEIERRLLSAL